MQGVYSLGKHRQLLKIFFLFVSFMLAVATFQGSLVYFLIHHWHFNLSHAYEYYAGVFSLLAALSICGGFLGGRNFGYRYGATIGVIGQSLGCILLALNFNPSFSLSFYIIGGCLFSPCAFSLLGDKQFDHYCKDFRFSFCYLGMNLGAFIGLLLAGFITQENSHIHLFSLCVIPFIISYFLIRYIPQSQECLPTNSARYKGLLILAFLFCMVFFLLQHLSLCYLLVLGISTMTIIFLLKLSIQYPSFRLRFSYFLLLSLFSISFWSLYKIVPTVVNNFIEHYVNTRFLSWKIPPAFILSLNPIFMMIVGTIMVKNLAKQKQQDINREQRFSLAVILICSAFFLLGFGASVTNMPLNMAWIFLFFTLQSAGEMLISPTGYAMVTDVFPEVKLRGFMLGIWEMFYATASSVSGILAHLSAKTFPGGVLDSSEYFLLIAIGGILVLLGINTIFQKANKDNRLLGVPQ